ncbi:MAG TPA: putative holin-like toxin [Bacilli bacterium]|nr:putative holin-like toxin [Bacilli bacterium]
MTEDQATMQLMLMFGMFVIALLKFDDKEK